MSYCERGSHSSTVGITWKQRHHFMWKPTVPVTLLLSVKRGKKIMFLEPCWWLSFSQNETASCRWQRDLKETRLWQWLPWVIRGPNSTRIMSWHQSHFSAFILLRALGWGISDTFGVEEGGEAVTALLSKHGTLGIHPFLSNHPQGNFYQGQVFPSKLRSTASRTSPHLRAETPLPRLTLKVPTTAKHRQEYTSQTNTTCVRQTFLQKSSC